MEEHRRRWWPSGLSMSALGRRLVDRLMEHGIDERAAGLSYYFVFALFPTLLFLTALVGLLPGPRLMDHLMGYVTRMLPGDAASLVTRTLGEVVAGASRSLVSIGALAALWAASNGMLSIMAGLNVALDARDDRPWWRRRLVALALTAGFSIFIVIALLLLVFGEWIGDAVAEAVGLGGMFQTLWSVLRWPVVIACVLTGITLVYYLAPTVRPRWRWVSPGAAVALAGWLVGSFGLRLYVSYFGNYNATYGSIGGVILLMLWVYLSSFALLIGAEINSEIERVEAGDTGA